MWDKTTTKQKFKEKLLAACSNVQNSFIDPERALDERGQFPAIFIIEGLNTPVSGNKREFIMDITLVCIVKEDIKILSEKRDQFEEKIFQAIKNKGVDVIQYQIISSNSSNLSSQNAFLPGIYSNYATFHINLNIPFIRN